jgi:hypothetical protein
MNSLTDVQNRFRDYEANPAILQQVTMPELDHALRTDIAARDDLMAGVTIANTLSKIALVVLPLIFLAIPCWLSFFILAPLTYYAFEMMQASFGAKTILTDPAIRTACLISKKACMERVFSYSPVMLMIGSCVKLRSQANNWESLGSDILGVNRSMPFQWVVY